MLKDRDEATDAERLAFLASDVAHRVLTRRELENYLFDKEVVQLYCARVGTAFDEARYDAAVNDIHAQDLKVVQQEVQAAAGTQGTVAAFKLELAKDIVPGTATYTELEALIFP